MVFRSGDLGDLGERGTLDGNSSILSFVLTLKESSDVLNASCLRLSPARSVSCACSVSIDVLAILALVGDDGPSSSDFAGDSGIEPLRQGHHPDVIFERQCRDFTEIQEWAARWRVMNGSGFIFDAPMPVTVANKA